MVAAPTIVLCHETTANLVLTDEATRVFSPVGKARSTADIVWLGGKYLVCRLYDVLFTH